MYSNSINENTVDKLIIKIPTRERGFDFLSSYTENIINENTRIILTLDEDDPTLNLDHPLLKHPQVSYVLGKSNSKIEAYNRDIDSFEELEWDVIMVGSDDMIPQTRGFDQIILDDMKAAFPRTDGALWYPTEESENELIRRHKRKIPFGSPDYKRKWISMLPIMGYILYTQLGKIYDPAYKSLWCDNEYTEILVAANKIECFNRNIVLHFHPAWNKEGKQDALYLRNDKNFKRDQAVYNSRQQERARTIRILR